MALVPNGRMRPQEKQSLLRNGLFSFAQAQQQNANQQPKPDPRLQVEQQQIGNKGQQPADGQNPQQAEPTPDTNPEDPTANADQQPAANMDVMQDRVQEQAEQGAADGTTPESGMSGDAKQGLVQFTKKMVQDVMGIPLRKLEQMGGFVNFKSDSQHNDKVDLKFPNWYWGRPELGEVSKQHKMQIIKAAQEAFNLFYEGSSGDDDTFTMSFSTVDPRMGMETAHDARLRRTYKALAQPNQGKPGAGAKAAATDSDLIKLAFTVSPRQEMAYDKMLSRIYTIEKSATASTIGELIKDRRDDLFKTMRNIAQGSK